MMRVAAVVVLAVGLTVLSPSSGSADAALPRPPAPAPCGQGSWVAGTVELCHGELVYRDYVYDDFGARTALAVPPFDPLSLAPLPSLPDLAAYGGYPPAGAQRSEDQTDLVALRLYLAGGTVHVEAELNTMFAPGVADLVLLVDRDGDPVTGGGTVPGVMANPSPATPLRATGWDDLYRLTGGDPAANTITASLPLPPAPHWKLWAVVTKADGTAMNVAFRGTGEHGAWWEDEQADALASGDITRFGQTVDTADLRHEVTRRARVAPGTIVERVYISATPLGEGVSDTGVPGPGAAPGSPAQSISQAFTMLGKYQPYGFYEPTGPAPHGLELALHGLAENHAARFYFPGFASPRRFATVMGEDRNRIIASPLGRGWRGWYSSYSERDVMDVLADVEANYAVDHDRVVISGYSMGGYGAMRIAALHPDLFAGVVNWVGYTGDVFNGTPLQDQFASNGSQGGADVNALELVGSLRNVPMVALYSGADELVHVTTALALEQQLDVLRVPSTFYLHPVAEHLTYALADDWHKESLASADDVRVHDPAHVTFRTDRRIFEPDLGLVPNRAYWVSGIVPAAGGYADVDALSLGCGKPEPVLTDTHAAGIDPVPWVSQVVQVTGSTPRAAANELHLTLHNVASLTIDTDHACLHPVGLAYRVVTDGPVTVRFGAGSVLSFDRAGTYVGP